MLQAVKEVTVWNDVNIQPNFIYLIDGDKAFGYINQPGAKPQYFKRPLMLYKRGRQFEPADIKLFADYKPDAEPTGNIVKVAGSKAGVFYSVDKDAHTCTCPGFKFRGSCKHVSEVCK